MMKALNLGRDPAQRIPAVVGMVFFAGAALLAATPAHAGRSCESRKPVPPQVIERAIVVTRPSWVPAEPSQTKNGPASVPVPVGGK